jgi:hypothetical protein
LAGQLLQDQRDVVQDHRVLKKNIKNNNKLINCVSKHLKMLGITAIDNKNCQIQLSTLFYLRRHSSCFEQGDFGFLEFAASGVGPSQIEQNFDVVELKEFLQAIFVHLDGGDVLQRTEENRF